ncbi:MAG: HAD family hydrolase [Mariprofundaceae bacterium]
MSSTQTTQTRKPIETINGVLFDLDGTLVDAFPPIINALNQTLKEFGRAEMTPVEIKRHTGRGDCGMKSLFAEQSEKASIRFLELHDAVYLEQVKKMDGADEILFWLRERSIPTAIVTSKGQHRAEAQIELLGWQDYFQSIIGKVDGRPEKPSPVPVQMACDALNVPASESIMIGDGIGDMKAGSRAGLFSIGMVDSFSDKELKESGSSICFKTLNEVHNWLREKIV